MITFISFILTILGSINWLLIGLLQYDFIAGLFGFQASIFSRIFYILFGMASIYLTLRVIINKGTFKVFERKKKEKKYSIAFIYVQLFLTIFLLIFGFITLFNKQLYVYFQFLLAITILDMGLNNKLIYKRNSLTIFYFIIGIAILIIGIFNLIGGYSARYSILY